MTLTMKALSDGEMDQLVREPQRALDLLLPEDDEAVNDPSLGYLAKAWHAIHYLLTGTSWGGDPPLNSLITASVELEDPDGEWGYGPPHILRPRDVAAFSRALDALSDEDLVNRFDPADMTSKEMYPLIWDRDPEDDDTLAYVMEYVAILRDFIRRASARDDGLVIAVV